MIHNVHVLKDRLLYACIAVPGGWKCGKCHIGWIELKVGFKCRKCGAKLKEIHYAERTRDGWDTWVDKIGKAI